MLFVLCTIISFLPIVFGNLGILGEWSYNNTKLWHRYSRYCAGNLQSPIDLQYNISHYNRRLKTIILDEIHSEGHNELLNSGLTIQFNIQNHYVFKDLSPSSEDYNVEQVHFHWGHANDNRVGSEHTHEGKSYPLEMHMVGYSSLYPTILNAMTNTRGLAVVGAFFEITDEPNPLLQPLVDALKRVRGKSQRTNVTELVDFKSLIGEYRLGRYYRYDGSLTTPPCFESVLWTVLVDPIPISLSQLHAFRYLHDEQAHIIKNTYRKVRKLGNRLLFRSFLQEDFQNEIEERSMSIENLASNIQINSKFFYFLLFPDRKSVV